MPGDWEPAPDGPPDVGKAGKRGRWRAVRTWCEEHRGEWATIKDVSATTGTNFRRWGYEVVGHLAAGQEKRYDLWLRLPKEADE